MYEEFNPGPAHGLGLRPHHKKIFVLYKKGAHPFVKSPKFIKKYEFF